MANESKPTIFNDEHWMTTADAMAYFKVSRRTLQRWCQDKEIPFSYVGGTKYFPKKFMERLMITKIIPPPHENPTAGPDAPAPTA